MSNYMTHPIDTTPTIRGIAGAAIENPALLAVKFDGEGKLVLPAAGDPIIGIVLADENTVKTCDHLHIQIKDITYWIAGAEIKAGRHAQGHRRGQVRTRRRWQRGECHCAGACRRWRPVQGHDHPHHRPRLKQRSE